MPAVSSFIAAAAVIGAGAAAKSQHDQAKSAARTQKRQHKKAEDTAQVQAAQVQASENLDDADIDLEGATSEEDRRAAASGNRLFVGRKGVKGKAATATKSGVKL
jgi:hypothetical protein